MENKIKEVKNENKKKKNKNKERKRLMSLFRGPEVENKWVYKTSEEESNCVKQSITDIMSEKPFLKLHQKTRKGDKNIANNVKTNDFKLTNELVLGLNSIIRSIEKKCVIGVIVTNPLALPLMDSIIDLCCDKQIPCLSIQSFDEMKTYLNISSLTAIAFKPNVSLIDSIFNKLYKTFQNIIHKNCSQNELNEQKEVKQEIKEEIRENRDNCEKLNKKEMSFDKSLFDILYTKESEDNYRQLIVNHLKTIDKSVNKPKDIESQELFVSFSSITELYFPETRDSNKILPKIEIILDEQPINSRDDSFAESLIESNDESNRKYLKRRSNSEKGSDLFDFKAPQIAKLEPNANRMQNRKKRKQMKKLK